MLPPSKDTGIFFHACWGQPFSLSLATGHPPFVAKAMARSGSVFLLWGRMSRFSSQIFSPACCFVTTKHQMDLRKGAWCEMLRHLHIPPALLLLRWRGTKVSGHTGPVLRTFRLCSICQYQNALKMLFFFKSKEKFII